MSKYKINIEIVDKSSYITVQENSVIDIIDDTICVINAFSNKEIVLGITKRKTT